MIQGIRRRPRHRRITRADMWSFGTFAGCGHRVPDMMRSQRHQGMATCNASPTIRNPVEASQPIDFRIPFPEDVGSRIE